MSWKLKKGRVYETGSEINTNNKITEEIALKKRELKGTERKRKEKKMERVEMMRTKALS